jgi:arsenate reductase
MSWDEFALPGAPALHYVFTVCDSAAGESCPYWPGHPATAHWGIPDPAAVEGSDDEKRRAFRAAFERLSARIGAFLRLPLETLGPDAAVQRLREIGRLP